MRRSGANLLLLSLLLTALPVLAEERLDWPQWGGPRRDGTSPATGVFPAGPFTLREVWRIPVDPGLSQPVVVGGRLFLSATSSGNEYLLALDAETAKELWRVPLGSSHPSLEWGPGSTPASDGERVFVLASNCKLSAFGAAKGDLLWQHDLKAEFKANDGSIGCWSSPLLTGHRVVMQVNGEPDKRVMAFDATTGEVAWTNGEMQTWARRTSPALVELGGARQVLVHDSKQGRGGLYALDPETGNPLWSQRFEEGDSWSGDSPLLLGNDLVGVVTWDDLRVVQVAHEGGTWTTRPVWRDHAIRAEILPFTVHAVGDRGYVYGFGGEMLSCFEAATGKLAWAQKVYPGSLLLLDGHLVVLSRAAGTVRVVVASSDGYHEVARQQIFTPGAASDTPPSFAGKRIYLRNSEELVALEVAASPPDKKPGGSS